MSEVEKLYSLAGVETIYIECPADYYGYKCGKTNWDDADCPCLEEAYPPFTAEKQIELIKWLMTNAKDYQYDVENGKYWFIIDDYRETKYRDFDEALAELITLYWQDLTEAEQNEIREILK